VVETGSTSPVGCEDGALRAAGVARGAAVVDGDGVGVIDGEGVAVGGELAEGRRCTAALPPAQALAKTPTAARATPVDRK
jgi:hypothetical protein